MGVRAWTVKKIMIFCVLPSLACCLVLVLWALISLPIAFYYVMQETYSGNSSIRSIGLNNSECSLPLPYSEGVCFEFLRDILESENCEVNDTGVVLIAKNNEFFARMAIEKLDLLNSGPECRQNILPFLCLYLFGMCGSNGEVVQPTMKQCESIKYGICTREWTLAITLGLDLPDCKILPVEQNISCITSNKSLESVSAITCQKHFLLDETSHSCVANCETWSQFDETTAIAMRATVLTSSCIGILLAIAALVISGIRQKAMLEFPSRFLVYITIDLIVLDLIVLVGASDTKLFCSSSSIANNSPTPFCIISGIVYSYTNIQFGLWWVFHLSILFWSVFFPFHYQKYKTREKLKYVHFVYVLVGIFLPTVSIIGTMVDFAVSGGSQGTIFLSEGLGYSQFTYPPLFCVPTTFEAGLYALVLPIEIILGIGGPLLLFICYGFYKNNKLVGAAEAKLLLVLCYYFVLTTLLIISFTIVLRNGNALYDAIEDYFDCEAQGLDPSNPCMRDFEQYSSPGFVFIPLTQSVLALYPLYVLIFVVNARELREKYKKLVIPQTVTTTITNLN